LPLDTSVAVYAFGTNVTLMQDFTTDRALINASIDAITSDGNTALYDAIFTAAVALEARLGRKAIVVMTDGVDTASTHTLAEAIAEAQAANAPVYTVGFGLGIDPVVLQMIATDTGGIFISGLSSAELQTLIEALNSAISAQYSIQYLSAFPESTNIVQIIIPDLSLATFTTPPCTGGPGAQIRGQVVSCTCVNEEPKKNYNAADTLHVSAIALILLSALTFILIG